MLNLWPYTLRRGHSDNPAEGACAMDAVNWLVHGGHGDTPECACPVIGAYVIAGNDAMPDDVRQKLLPYLHRIAGSRSKNHQWARARALALGAVRVVAPMALGAAGLSEHAAFLRSLPDDVPLDAAGIAAWEATNAAREARARLSFDWVHLKNEMVVAARAGNASAYAAEAAEKAAATKAAKGSDASTAKGFAEASMLAGHAASEMQTWDPYFTVLDDALSAGPQGEPWSAHAVAVAVEAFDARQVVS